MDKVSAEQRQFTRAPLTAAATIGNEESLWAVTVLDISLNGVLIARPEHWRARIGQVFDFDLSLPFDDCFVVMRCAVSREDEVCVGLRRIDIGMESISAIRQLLEREVGDPDLVRRELSQLGSLSDPRDDS